MKSNNMANVKVCSNPIHQTNQRLADKETVLDSYLAAKIRRMSPSRPTFMPCETYR